MHTDTHIHTHTHTHTHTLNFIKEQLIYSDTDYDFNGRRWEFPGDGTWGGQMTVAHQCVLPCDWVGAVLLHIGQQVLQRMG